MEPPPDSPPSCPDSPVKPYALHLPHARDPAPFLAQALQAWGRGQDLWVFGYASLIWRPDFDFVERRAARVHGWHRALRMWSRVNRGTPEQPGLVFGLLRGGSCQGVVFRIPQADGEAALHRLWEREMVTGVYDPRWLRCATPDGEVRALAFTLSRLSPNFTGELVEAQYRKIFAEATGRYGSTLDYALSTLEELKRHNIQDRALERLLRFAQR
jgi:cation transport protein ChaC